MGKLYKNLQSLVGRFSYKYIMVSKKILIVTNFSMYDTDIFNIINKTLNSLNERYLVNIWVITIREMGLIACETKYRMWLRSEFLELIEQQLYSIVVMEFIFSKSIQ